MRLGCPQRMPGWTVQRNCGSGLQAIVSAMHAIQLGNSELVLAGGTEAMSHAPLLFPQQVNLWLQQWLKSKTVIAKLKLANIKNAAPAAI